VRALATDPQELAGLIAACKEGRFYDAEAWVAGGRPLQVAPGETPRRRRQPSPLHTGIVRGHHDFVLLLLCNGYRMELESHSPLNDALETRRWDILGLLLDWGADPLQADVWRILDTYERTIFDRFWAAGIDLTSDGAMAEALARSTSNRPLYGFARNYRERDPRIQRALDLGLGAAIGDHKDKAVSLCFWAGANPDRRVGEIDDPDDEDAWGMTAIERALSEGMPQYLKKLGFDPDRHQLQPLYQHVHDLVSLKALAEIEPPHDWHAITARFVQRVAMSVRFSFHVATIQDLEAVFDLGGLLRALDRNTRRDLRHLLLGLVDSDAQHLFRLLRDPQNVDPEAFIDLIAHEKLGARYMEWPRRSCIDKNLLEQIATARRMPGSIRRWAKAELVPERQAVTRTYLKPRDGDARFYSRAELYDLVWSTPLTVLAKAFALSDNGLRKRCKALHVPTPPKGYWQKIKNGQRVSPIPLPKLPSS